MTVNPSFDATSVTTPRRLFMLSTKEAASGAPMALLRLAAGLSEAGWAVRAAFLYHQKSLDKADFPSACLLSHPPQGLRDHVQIVRDLYRAIKDERPDAIICFLPYASILGTAIARIIGVKVRIVSHRVPRTTYGRSMRLIDLLAAWTGFYTDVVAVSRGVAALCRPYPPRLRRRLKVIYNGLRGWRASALSKAQARARLGVADDQFVVIAVGRLEPQKNHRLLIEALALTRTKSLLVLAGDGEMRPAIESQIRELALVDRVRLLGAIPRTDVADLLAAADVFAQPSLFEGQSNALLEALNAGLPCLVGNIPEQIETVAAPNGKVAGAVLPLDDPDRWARAMDQFADPFRRAQANAVVTEQAAKFTFAHMVTGFEEVLSEARPR